MRRARPCCRPCAPSADGRRRHGCHAPWDAHQLYPWTSLAVSVGALYGLCLPLLPRALAVPGCACHAAAVALMQAFGWATILARRRAAPAKSAAGDDAEAGRAAPAGARAHRCGRCRVLVEGFDHHCVFLNTCVGSAAPASARRPPRRDGARAAQATTTARSSASRVAPAPDRRARLGGRPSRPPRRSSSRR